MRLITKPSSLKIAVFDTDKRALQRFALRKMASPFACYIVSPIRYAVDVQGFIIGYQFPARNFKKLFETAFKLDRVALQCAKFAMRRSRKRGEAIRKKRGIKRVKIVYKTRVCKLPKWDFKTLVERARDEARQVLIDDLV